MYMLPKYVARILK